MIKHAKAEAHTKNWNKIEIHKIEKHAKDAKDAKAC